MAFNFTWLGNKVADFVFGEIDARLNASGQQWLAMSRALAPVRTGRLRAEEGYTVANRTLTLIMGAPYDIFQEFGTRNMRPHPHVRPALNAIGRIWSGNIEMAFNAPEMHGLLAHTGMGRKTAGYTASTHPSFRPLTARQAAHVEKHLIPGIKKHHRKNVKRAKFTVRHYPT